MCEYGIEQKGRERERTHSESARAAARRRGDLHEGGVVVFAPLFDLGRGGGGVSMRYERGGEDGQNRTKNRSL
jgi:hypothetical protein